MKDWIRLSLVWVAALCAAGVGAHLSAHELPPEVNVYIAPVGDRLRVLVRVPAALVPDARLPVRPDGYFDIEAGLDKGPGPMAAVASDIVRNLDLMDDDRPLPAPSSIGWTVSPPSDTSFDTYEGAAARVAVVPPAETRIDPHDALLDFWFDYPLSSQAHRLSVRVNGYGASRGARMQVRYVEPDAVRTLVTTGTPRRIALEPGWQSVGAMFARLGIEQLALGVVHLMFVLCLAIPPRSLGTALTLFGTFAAGWILALAASAVVSGPATPAGLLVFQTLAAGALAVAGLQNITAARLRWVRAAAAFFGMMDGLALGFAYQQNVPLAGSHASIAVVSFLLPILLGSLWLLIVAHPVIGLVRRSRLPEQWATVLLSAIPIHVALHGLMVGR